MGVNVNLWLYYHRQIPYNYWLEPIQSKTETKVGIDWTNKQKYKRERGVGNLQKMTDHSSFKLQHVYLHNYVK